MSLLALFRSRDAKTPTDSPPANVSRKRLTKKSLVRLYAKESEPPQEFSYPMGNHVSFENIPRPQRQPRTSASLPELPCLPIYETLTLSTGSSRAPDHSSSEGTLTKVREKPRPLSKCTPQNTSRLHFVAQQKSPTFKLVPAIYPQPDPQSNPKPPLHDRASILADAYRSILPDFDAMEQVNSPELYPIIKRRPSELDLKRSQISLYRPQPSESAYRQSTVAKQVIVEMPSSPQHQSFSAQIDSVTPPVSAASSITVVDSSERGSEEESTPPAIPPQAPQRKQRAMNHSRVAPPRSPVASSSKPAVAQSPKPPSPRFKIPKGENCKTSLALQICTNMLTDELKKALFPKRQGVDEDPQAAKLQVLLLIEAYEGVMDNCREQLAQSEHENSNVEVKHAKEAMEILGHWLDSLYEIYGEAFGHDDPR
ncbi:hypothetical protein QBC40DRAFT_101671 [Triangularia verruculosa]|uniref:Uncharacterized protein n=1 Tax=Triangularia verruculosa TaxID=2587418 RepID=A0AAN6XBV2_9PEZI|nr:hypothetical protein QBC40DRAFT_101671 [Triangularia verruculosa]